MLKIPLNTPLEKGDLYGNSSYPGRLCGSTEVSPPHRTSPLRSKFRSAPTASSLTQHSMFLPRRSTTMMPACRSSLMWWDTVDAAIFSSSPSSPTHRRASSTLAHLVPGGQTSRSRKKMASRCRFASALNISAYRVISIILWFDIFRIIEPLHHVSSSFSLVRTKPS